MDIRPILFNTEMVRAILRGEKTVTRRVIKPQPKMRLSYTCMGSHNVGKWGYPSPTAYLSWGKEWKLDESVRAEDLGRVWTPPCHTDDILWVRETWSMHGNPNAGRPMHYDYRADREDPRFWDNGFIAEWRPSIHMPREAARIFLRVTGVTTERLHDAQMMSIQREGVSSCAGCGYAASECPYANNRLVDAKHERCPCAVDFRRIWNDTVKKADIPKYGWNADPVVWVIEFDRCEKPADF